MINSSIYCWVCPAIVWIYYCINEFLKHSCFQVKLDIGVHLLIPNKPWQESILPHHHILRSCISPGVFLLVVQPMVHLKKRACGFPIKMIGINPGKSEWKDQGCSILDPMQWDEIKNCRFILLVPGFHLLSEGIWNLPLYHLLGHQISKPFLPNCRIPRHFCFKMLLFIRI